MGDGHEGGSLASVQKKSGDSTGLSPLIPFPLVTEAQVGDKTAISLQVRPLKVFQQPAATPNHFQEAAAAMMIFLVGIEMALEVGDASREDRDLDRSAALIILVKLIVLDYFLAIDGHSSRASSGAKAAREAPPRLIFVRLLAKKTIGNR
jgi:hypothetical protein